MGIFRGQNNLSQMMRLLKLAGSLSLGLGVAIALLFIAFSQSLFGLLTAHENVIENIRAYVLWLLPLLSFGSIAYMLDGYFLGLTQGPTLRRASVISATLGFAPLAFIAWQVQSTEVLWLGLTGFMAARVITLSLAVPSTLRPESP